MRIKETSNLKLFFNFLTILTIIYVSYSLRSHFPETSLIKHLCFFTNISMYMNLIYYIINFIQNIGIIKIFTHNFLKKYFNFCYTISFVVFILYWPMKLVHVIYKLDAPEIPLWLDIFLHGGFFVLNFIEHINTVHLEENFKKLQISYKVYLLFLLGYSIFLYILYTIYDIIIYPDYDKWSFAHLVVITTIAFGFIMIADLTYHMTGRKIKIK